MEAHEGVVYVELACSHKSNYTPYRIFLRQPYQTLLLRLSSQSSVGLRHPQMQSGHLIRVASCFMKNCYLYGL